MMLWYRSSVARRPCNARRARREAAVDAAFAVPIGTGTSNHAARGPAQVKPPFSTAPASRPVESAIRSREQTAGRCRSSDITWRCDLSAIVALPLNPAHGALGGVDRTWGSCGAFSVCDGQPTIENCGPCDGYSVSPFGRPTHPPALSHAGIGNVIN